MECANMRDAGQWTANSKVIRNGSALTSLNAINTLLSACSSDVLFCIAECGNPSES